MCQNLPLTAILALFQSRVKEKESNELQEKRNLQVCQVGLEDLENLGVPVDRKGEGNTSDHLGRDNSPFS